MVHDATDASSNQSRKLRKMAGRYIKACRESEGLTQRDLAEAIGLKYYTFVSQLENGHGRVPPHVYEPLAKALNVETKQFAKEMVKFYSPWTYKALFGKHPHALTLPENAVEIREDGGQ